MKVLAFFLLVTVVSARPGARDSSDDESKEGKSLELTASLPSPGMQPMLVFMPDYNVHAPLDLPRRRFFHRVRPATNPVFAQRPLPAQRRPLQQQADYAQSLAHFPYLVPIPLPMLQAQKAYEFDISDWIAGIEESIKAEEDSVLLAASDNKKTSLILKPVAKAVAGPNGVAVASPVAKAILRKGQIVSIDFDPEAVAIAGPGGSADAQPKLVISYASEGQSLEDLITTPADEPLPSSTLAPINPASQNQPLENGNRK